MLPQIYFIFITHCLVQVVFCQHIQLFPYNQTKNCNISLVEENDTILMYGKVDFHGNIPASSVVNFEIKRKSETSFQFFSFLKVPEDCDTVFHYGNCFKTDDPKVFKLSLNITAFTVNSEADVRTEFVYRETTFFSEIRNLPIVYGSKTDLVVVYVNDQVVHFQQTEVSINDTQVTIVSVCREHFADNCKQQLSDLETGTLVKSGKEKIVYNTTIKGRYSFKLTYSACNIERNISFTITKRQLWQRRGLSISTKLKVYRFNWEKSITLTKVNLYDVNQTYFDNEHYFVYQIKVNVTEDISSLSEIRFEIKSKSYPEFRVICSILVEACERKIDETCRCQYNSKENIYLATINITAKVAFSSGTVRGVMIFKKYPVYSNELRLPMIFENPETVCLFINDTKITDLEQCNVTTDKDFAVIVFFCSSASSYKLEIEDGSKIISNTSNVLVHTVNTTTQKDIRLYQRDLESNVVLRHYQCRLQAESSIQDCRQLNENCSAALTALCVALGLIFLLTVGLIVFICYSRRNQEDNSCRTEC
ncbi:hypothetical protein Bpfe_014927 [Biomphalaria pfeifferi]|uniref:Uncharacterized protein n=1 Tax=Biomphalaria pfeifferi TaxID=112525 RepID=A0AAD8F8K1_BIOPF|nr:hypothetical protein Bpfe_014927 [Biomphalaria pfeifferi]